MNRYRRIILPLAVIGLLAACASPAAAYAVEREASAHMFMTGAVLAAAIAGQFPDEFPTSTEPSDTAMAPVETVNPLVLIGTALVALTALTLTRRTLEVRARVQ